MENPILRRELKTALRSPLTLTLGAVYLVVLGGIIWGMWPQEGIFSIAAQASRSILMVFTVTQLLLVILYAPAFAATSITAEKEQNTYDLLFASLLRPRQIVVGKLFSSILCLLIFVALSFPIFASCFFLGAVSVRETCVIYLVTAASSVFFGLLGLCLSAVVASSHTALILTYLSILLFTAGPWIPYVIFQNRPEAASMILGIRSLSPLAAMASVVAPTFEGIGAAGEYLLPPAWKIYLLFAVAGSAVMVLFLLASVYLFVGRRPRPHQRAIDDPAELMKRKLRFPFYLIDPMRRKKNIADWMNPVFAKEMRGKAFGGGIWIFRSAYVCFAVSTILMAMVAGVFGGQSPDVIRTVALVFQLGLIVLVVPSLTAGAITQERERFSLDLLRMARVRAMPLLIGKLTVACIFVLFLVIGSLPLWYVIHYMETNTLKEILVCLLIIGTTVLLAMMTGLFGSAVSRRTPSATALAYGLLFLLVIGTLFPLLTGDLLAPQLRDLVYSFNPFISSIQALTTGLFQGVAVLWRLHLLLALGLSAVFFLIAYLRVKRMLLPEK